MLDLLEDIKSALEAKLYRPALALALTVPDICGKIAYPELKTVKKRYEMWFNEYVTKGYFPDEFEDKLKFDGEKCYKLRCSILHSGKAEVPIDEFELVSHYIQTDGIYFGNVFQTSQGTLHYSDGSKKNTIKDIKFRLMLAVYVWLFTIRLVLSTIEHLTKKYLNNTAYRYLMKMIILTE
jgi:hypothetical protein